MYIIIHVYMRDIVLLPSDVLGHSSQRARSGGERERGRERERGKEREREKEKGRERVEGERTDLPRATNLD